MLQGVPAARRKADSVLRVQHTRISRAGAHAVGGDGTRTAPSPFQRREGRTAASAFRFQDCQSGAGEEMKPAEPPVAAMPAELNQCCANLYATHLAKLLLGA